MYFYMEDIKMFTVHPSPITLAKILLLFEYEFLVKLLKIETDMIWLIWERLQTK